MFSPLFVTNYCLVQGFFFGMYLDTIFHSLPKKKKKKKKPNFQCFIFGNIKPTSRFQEMTFPHPKRFKKWYSYAYKGKI